MSRIVHVPYAAEQDEDGGGWSASAMLRAGVGAVGEGETREAAVDDLRSGLTALIEVVGVPDVMEIELGDEAPLSAPAHIYGRAASLRSQCAFICSRS